MRACQQRPIVASHLPPSRMTSVVGSRTNCCKVAAVAVSERQGALLAESERGEASSAPSPRQETHTHDEDGLQTREAEAEGEGSVSVPRQPSSPLCQIYHEEGGREGGGDTAWLLCQPASSAQPPSLASSSPMVVVPKAGQAAHPILMHACMPGLPACAARPWHRPTRARRELLCPLQGRAWACYVQSSSENRERAGAFSLPPVARLDAHYIRPSTRGAPSIASAVDALLLRPSRRPATSRRHASPRRYSSPPPLFHCSASSSYSASWNAPPPLHFPCTP